jgi:hypothetical protein
MEVLLFACADSAVIDSRTNRLSLFNLVEELNAADFPCSISGLALVLVLLRSSSEPDETVVTVQSIQDGEIISSFSLPVQFHHHLRARVVADLDGLSARGAGIVELSIISSNQTLMASWKIRVNHLLRAANEALALRPAHPSGPLLPPISLTANGAKAKDTGRRRKKH